MGIGIRALVVGAILASGPGFVRADEIEDGNGLSERGLFAKALPYFERAAAADPGNPSRALLVASCLQRLDRHVEVQAALAAARAKAPEDPALLLQEGNSWFWAAMRPRSSPGAIGIPIERLAKARATAETLLEKDPKNAEARALKARCLLVLPETDPAMVREMLDRAVADDPKNARVRMELARHCLRVAEHDKKNKDLWIEAEKQCRAVTELDPASGEAAFYAVYAKHWQGAGNYRDDYKKAILLWPGSEVPLDLYFTMLRRQADRYIPVLDDLLLKRPGDASMLLHKASVLLEDGKVDRAAAVLRDARAANPQDPLVALRSGTLLVKAGRADDGLAEVLAAVDLCGGILDCRVYDGADSLAVQDGALLPEQRDRIWKKLFETWPGQVNGPANAEVWWRDEKSDYARSLEWCERALQADPADAMVLSDVGLMHWTAGPLLNAVKAEEFFRKAVDAAESLGMNAPEKSVGYRLAVDNLVKLLLSQRRWKDALEFAETHLKNDPRYDSVRRAISSASGEGR